MNTLQTQLHSQALELSSRYLRTEIELLNLLQQIEKEKVYLALGCSSMFAYCTELLKLSEERSFTLINVQRKCVEVPVLKEKIESGLISLTKARRIASVITPQNQSEWIAKAETLPKAELERCVAAVNPEPVREQVRPVAEDRYALKVGVSEELLKKLRRLQALLSNQKKTPVSLEQVLEYTADEVLKKKDPTAKPPVQLGPGQVKSARNSVGGIVTVAERTPIPAQIKRAVLQRDQGKCQYKSQGHKCESSYFIHLHHKKPVSEGGNHSLDNLVTLCSQHHTYWHEKTPGAQLLGRSIAGEENFRALHKR